MSVRRALPFTLAPTLGVGVAVFVFGAGIARGQTDVDAFQQASGALAAAGIAFLALIAQPAWTLSIGLALTAFSAHWPLIGLPVSVDRVVLGIGIGRVLFGELRSERRRLHTEPIHWLLALATIYAVLSAILAGTVTENGAMFALFDRFGIVPFIMFLVAPLAFPTERERRVLLGTLVALGTYLGFTAVFERVGPKALVYPRYILDPSVGIHADRARGPFVEAVANGLVLYACGVAAIIAVVAWRDRRWRMFAAFVAALCALGVLLTVTRGVWLAGVAGTLLALLASPQTRRVALPAALLGLGLVVGAFAAFPGLQGQAQRRVDDQQPLWDRLNSNAAAGRMVERRPLFGFGWGTFKSASIDYYRQAPDYPITSPGEAHNVFASNAAEIGLIGTTLWAFAWLAALVGSLLRRGPPQAYPWRIGLIAIFVSCFVAANTSPFGYALPALILWTWAGLVRGAADPTLLTVGTAGAAPRRGPASLSR